MRKVLILTFLITVTKTMAQLPLPSSYVDIGHKVALEIEASAANSVDKSKRETSKSWGTTIIGSGAEKAGLTSLGKPVRYVHFINYANMCDSYSNGRQKKFCEERVKYLKHSHDVVFELLSVSPRHKMRKGVRDLIWEKYASISIMIIKELEIIKRESEKEDGERDINY
ncbi:hypothetical protein [Zobellia galactanivorans]|uniref:Hypothetical periplasmic protein n=1 Tax=Zobellia galactanivorans (strain DSM 12802 / CCUG 47099 / CIP 106680 / NCIMB 13871 / Dsij) TaxID=63186 RepID=G0KZX7_ZOBGA|nr:hypothetical protein [Zobellia galactanivorans]MBU3027535.1 hypothetical protein [Zobellia galactanivorans]CAZ97245.1 Hypothetical periplasmic protein [Zobellia galactanivorans]